MTVFSSTVFNPAVFNTGNVAPVVSSAALGDIDYRAYRKRLKKMLRAFEKNDSRRYVKNIVEVAEISEDLPVATPEISQSVKALELGAVPVIDYEQFAADIKKLLEFIDKQIMFRQETIIEEEDELVLLSIL